MSVPDVDATRESCVDTRVFCGRAGQASGVLDPALSSRLRSVVHASAEPGGYLDWQVRGRLDNERRPRIEVTVTGSIALTCQRCLEVLEHRVDARRTVIFVPPGALGAVEDEAADEDLVAFAATLTPLEWIEEEVLLSLPYAPLHPDGTCAHGGTVQSTPVPVGTGSGPQGRN
jgi:uncharacterized protein